jgi:hypothetical protein
MNKMPEEELTEESITVKEAQDALRCVACKQLREPGLAGYACVKCQRKYPPSLLKAIGDSYDYALRLRTGEVIYFQQATVEGEFITLSGTGKDPFQQADELRYSFERGLDVRLDDIVWCADLGH